MDNQDGKEMIEEKKTNESIDGGNPDENKECFDSKNEKRAHIGWLIFFVVTTILIIGCYIVIRLLS